jgi:hypothetical protein
MIGQPLSSGAANVGPKPSKELASHGMTDCPALSAIAQNLIERLSCRQRGA